MDEMTIKFSVIKLSEEAETQIICDTMSHYEAKNKFKGATLNSGEQVVLRSHMNGETKVLNVRDNGYCA